MGATMEKAKKPAKVTEAKAGDVLAITVPFRRTAKYAQREVYFSLRQDEAEVLRGVLEGLEEQHAKMQNGKPVQTTQDALRWLIEAVGQASR